MTVRSIYIWCAGLFVIGLTLGVNGRSSLGYEMPLSGGSAPAASPTQTNYPAPIAAQPAAYSAPAYIQPQQMHPAAGAQRQATPTPANMQPPVSPVPANNQPLMATPQPNESGVPLRPIPSNEQLSSATPQQAANACDDDEECTEFCGMPVCSPPGRYWLRAEYLSWWTSGTRLPPLVTMAPDGESPNLANRNTTILFGDETVGTNMRSGYRTTIGMWLDNCNRWGLELDYFTIGNQSNGYSLTGNGNPVIGRPFFDVQSNRQAAQLVAQTDVVTGTVAADVNSFFQSAGLLVSRNLCSGCNSCNECDECGGCGECDECKDPCRGWFYAPSLNCCRTDLVAGIRYYDLTDSVAVGEDLLVTDSGSPHFGTTYSIRDNFRTRNEFAGGEIGLRTQIYRGRWSLDILTKVAIGNTRQSVVIGGTTVITPLGENPNTIREGILAVGSNSGTYSRDVFTMIPQINAQLGYQVNCHWKAYVGYSLLYWGNVARAADQIDLNVDPRNWPSGLSPSPTSGLPFPQFGGNTSAYWAQGLSLGTEFRF